MFRCIRAAKLVLCVALVSVVCCIYSMYRDFIYLSSTRLAVPCNISPDACRTKVEKVTISSRINLKNEFNTRTKERQTELGDIYISVKTTKKNHILRMKVLLDTWIPRALNQTYIFTDENDKYLRQKLPKGHVINTKCPKSHFRSALNCKFAQEYDHYMKTSKRWFCHMDDDNYVNVDNLLTLLRQYDHRQPWYLGRESQNLPVFPPDNPKLMHAKFWFATLGAGVCLSRALAEKMYQYAGNGGFISVSDYISMPDDCTLGFILNYLLKVNVTVVKQFHSHMEDLFIIKDLEKQITLSYQGINFINVKGFSFGDDRTRFHSLQCRLYPDLKACAELTSNIN